MVDWPIITARFLQYAATLVLFGSSLFYLYGFHAGQPGALFRRWAWPHLVLFGAALVALAAVLGWLMAEAALLTGESRAALDPAVLWSVLLETSFGGIVFLRIGLLVVSVVLLLVLLPEKQVWIAQAVVGGFVVASFAWTGHGIYDDGIAGVVHLSGDVLHLLAAGIWIGALVPLAMLIMRSHRTQSETAVQAAHHGLQKFSGIGLAVVSALVFTGAINSWFLVGLSNWQALFTTPYGLTLVAKLALFGLMLILAAANRFWLTPKLGLAMRDAVNISTTGSFTLADATRSLRYSVLTETALALLVLGAVAYFGTLEPPVAG